MLVTLFTSSAFFAGIFLIPSTKQISSRMNNGVRKLSMRRTNRTVWPSKVNGMTVSVCISSSYLLARQRCRAFWAPSLRPHLVTDRGRVSIEFAAPLEHRSEEQPRRDVLLDPTTLLADVMVDANLL